MEKAPQGAPQVPVEGTCRSCGAITLGVRENVEFSYGKRLTMKWTCQNTNCGRVRYDPVR